MAQPSKGGGGGGGGGGAGGGGVGAKSPPVKRRAPLHRVKTQHLGEMQARQVHQSLAAQEHNEMQRELREHGELLCAVGMGDAFGEESAANGGGGGGGGGGGRTPKRAHSAVAVSPQLVVLVVPAQALHLALAAHAEHHAPTEPVPPRPPSPTPAYSRAPERPFTRCAPCVCVCVAAAGAAGRTQAALVQGACGAEGERGGAARRR